MGIERKIGNRKNKFLMFTLTFFFILLCVGVTAGASLYNYLSSFSMELRKNPKSVKPYAVKGKDMPVNILVLGVDIGTPGASEQNNHKRTDTIMLLNYNPKYEGVNVVSIPRDLLITVKGKNQKINAAHAIGGVSYIIDAVEQLLDLRINYYGKVDYTGFRELIDKIGGVEMTIPQRMEYDDPGQKLHIHFKKGETVHLDGKKAEEFFRWRKNNDGTGLADGDLGRIENQHLFIEKVMEKFKSVAIIPKIPEILKVIPRYAETNMDAETMLKYGLEITKVKKENINMSTLQGDFANIDGAAYIVYDEKKNTLLLSVLHGREALNQEERLERSKLSVQVLNGTHINGLAGSFSEALKSIGYTEVKAANGKKASKTTATVYGINRKLLPAIREDLGLANVTYSEEKKGSYDIVVILGEDYENR
jgi:polyisoprenyl-teichoic acid--peptidoglycan teichoic acid transferase